MSVDAGIAAVSEEQLDELLALGSATIYEASGLDCALDAALRPVWRGARLTGRALPLRCHPADNLALHHGLEAARPGDVLVADGATELCGYWGEVMAIAAQARGVRGLVIDGGVRDTVEQEQLAFPVFSRGVSVRRTGKFWPGQVGVPLTVGGIPVTPGDAVVADADGVVVLPAHAVTSTLDRARQRVAKEQDYFTRLRAGELTLDIMGLRRD
jgi:4-hydroxy-4-methyl-2-oxoglutarate aldolase